MCVCGGDMILQKLHEQWKYWRKLALIILNKGPRTRIPKAPCTQDAEADLQLNLSANRFDASCKRCDHSHSLGSVPLLALCLV